MESIFDHTGENGPGFRQSFHDTAVSLLRQYLRIPTLNPPGNEKPGVDFLRAVLAEHGLSPKVFETAPGRFALSCAVSGSDPSLKNIVMVNHVDVVPAEKEEWECDPFGGELKDGCIWGRGALDMKGMAVMQLMAMLAVHHRRDPIKRGVVFCALPDEETNGWKGAAVMADKHLDELNPALVFNEGGYGVKDMLMKGVVFALEVTEKMSMKLRLTTHGKSGHGNQPPPETALTSLAEWITRVHGLKYPMNIHPAVREAFRRLAGRKKFPESLLLRRPDSFPFRALVGRELGSDPTLNALTRTTVAVTVLRSGEAFNVVPGRAEAVLDVRMIPGTDPEKVIADVRALAPGADADIEILSPPEAGKATPFDTPAFRIIEEALLAAVPGALVVPFMDIGGSDSKHFRAKGVPCYGIIPAVITEEELGTIHGVNERLSLENLSRGTDVIYSALLRLCNEGALTPLF